MVTRREPHNTADLSLLKLKAKLDGQMCQVPPRFFNHSTLIGLTKSCFGRPHQGCPSTNRLQGRQTLLPHRGKKLCSGLRLALDDDHFRGTTLASKLTTVR